MHPDLHGPFAEHGLRWEVADLAIGIQVQRVGVGVNWVNIQRSQCHVYFPKTWRVQGSFSPEGYLDMYVFQSGR